MTDPYSLPAYANLIDAIRRAPDDDLPRLVAADWLEEMGEAERSQFIRVQVEKAALERASGGKLPVKGVRCGLVYKSRVGLSTSFDYVDKAKKGSVIDIAPSGLDDELTPEWKKGWIVEKVSDAVTPDDACGEVELEKATPCPLRDRWRELAKLEGELLPKPGTHFPDYVCSPIHRPPIYTRGFEDSIRIRGADWITHHAEILKRNPVRKMCLVLSGVPPLVNYTGGVTRWLWESHVFIGAGAENLACEEYPGIEFEFEREPIYVGNITAAVQSWTTTALVDALPHHGVEYPCEGGPRDGRSFRYDGAMRIVVPIPEEVTSIGWMDDEPINTTFRQGTYQLRRHRNGSHRWQWQG